MTKRWHTTQDYCSDPSGFEAHRRTRLPEAHAKELADLRRQADELMIVLEWIRNLAVVHLDHAEQEVSWRSFAERVKGKAGAALARVGGECETCLHSQLNPDGGHCYMFKEKPPRRCAQWQQARYGGGGEEA